MSTHKKNIVIPKGDYVTAGEAEMDPAAEILERCRVIDELVADKTFTLPEALEAYDVSIEQYFGSRFIDLPKHKEGNVYSVLGIALTTGLFIELASAMLKIMDVKNSKLTPKAQKVVNDMNELITVK